MNSTFRNRVPADDEQGIRSWRVGSIHYRNWLAEFVPLLSSSKWSNRGLPFALIFWMLWQPMNRNQHPHGHNGNHHYPYHISLIRLLIHIISCTIFTQSISNACLLLVSKPCTPCPVMNVNAVEHLSNVPGIHRNIYTPTEKLFVSLLQHSMQYILSWDLCCRIQSPTPSRSSHFGWKWFLVFVIDLGAIPVQYLECMVNTQNSLQICTQLHTLISYFQPLQEPSA